MSISRVSIQSQLVEMARSPTAYFHRLLNDIIDTANGQSGQSGVSTVSPDGSGDVAITHGFAVPNHPPTLAQCSVQPSGGTFFSPQIMSVTSTVLTVRLFDGSGAAITTGSYDLAWKVAG
jgi:hypothetical protein